MALQGLFSKARDELKREVPYKQELIQLFVLAAWIIALANRNVGLTFFLNFFTSFFYYCHNYVWGDNKSEWNFLFIVFSFTAAMVSVQNGVANTVEDRVIVVFNWLAFILFAQDEVNEMLN